MASIIVLTTRADSGNYTCRVRGEGGRVAETSFRLTLIGEKLLNMDLFVYYLYLTLIGEQLLNFDQFVSLFFHSWTSCNFKSHLSSNP